MSYTDSVLVELRGLSKSYGTHDVLTDLDLTLPPGIHALLGPNGAGKTTLVNILSTLIPYDSGEVRVLGLDPRRDRTALQGRISLTGQYAAVDGRLSGMENMLMMGRLFGLSRRAARRRADVLLERFDLTAAAGKRAETYSGGMRRKLDIAASLIAEPQLIFLDEPTTGLDTRSRQALWDEITALAESGASILLTTQYLEEADVLAERIMVLHGGRIVADGTAAELKSRVGGSTIQLHDHAGHILDEIPTGGSAADVAHHLAAIADAHPDVEVTVRRPTLDEVFLELTGSPGEQDEADEDPTGGDRTGRKEVAA
ncbi:ABC transporter ATP-binding protein [Prauserella rugosa]|uniref:ABC-2 type transport system ATP-binding protein n=1 Tax=Prauserella rugosa TaxID=43354 RepID=A0A660C8X8_9PSEU|nr:ATP-binding cassette domain-containing protein [Prauserella rugosa]KID28189.1 ABC-type multidrug transport system, ATPase component [Prauserella sp. Am3]KMS92014.1 ABC transporter ATP-binding protein [Streptomyces regensis]TWH18273.1 ABC-2 type transport system ATP-binding protein [Prauserella rugosa]